MTQSINDRVDADFICRVAIARRVESVKGMLPAVTQIGVEIHDHHQSTIIIEYAVHRRGVVGTVQQKSHAETPGNPPAGHLFNLVDVKETVKNRMFDL